MPILTKENIKFALSKANSELSQNIVIKSIVELHSPAAKYQLLFTYLNKDFSDQCDALIANVLLTDISAPPAITHGIRLNSIVFENPVTAQVIKNLRKACEINDETAPLELPIENGITITGLRGGTVTASITNNGHSFFSSFTNNSEIGVNIVFSATDRKSTENNSPEPANYSM